MEEIIKIHEYKGQKVIDARELHGYLESNRQFGNWIKQRIESYGFIEDEDYTVFNKFVKNPQGGRPVKQYAITIDMAKELCMIENNDKGRHARRYFIRMEKMARQPQIPLPTKKELAQMVIEAENEIDRLNKDIEEKKPLVRYAEAVQKADDTILLRQLAKYISNKGQVKVGQNRLFQWMRTGGYLNKRNEPYQRYVDMGLFGYHETNIENPEKSFTKRTTTVTGKGRVYFINKYLNGAGIKTLDI